jgi:hypothetical protein
MSTDAGAATSIDIGADTPRLIQFVLRTIGERGLVGEARGISTMARFTEMGNASNAYITRRLFDDGTWDKSGTFCEPLTEWLFPVDMD